MKDSLFPRVPPQPKILTAMPVAIQYVTDPRYATVKTLKTRSGLTFIQKYEHLGPYRYRHADAYAIRDAFLSISNSSEAVAFLEQCGPFRARVHKATMSDIEGWQMFFREWLVGGYGLMPFPPVIELSHTENERIGGVLSWDISSWRSDDNSDTQARAIVNCDSALEAIGATVALDLIAGANFKTCVWCTKPFEVTKDNGRQYCTMACAHRAGQKRRRAEAKALQGVGKPKKIKTKSTKGKV
jgi:hypothetical protein